MRRHACLLITTTVLALTIATSPFGASNALADSAATTSTQETSSTTDTAAATESEPNPTPGGGIQMLPPVDFNKPPLSCDNTKSQGGGLLYWDGSTPIRCVPNSAGDKTGALSASSVTAKTNVTTPQVTIPNAAGPLNVTSLTTLVNLLNTPTCLSGTALTKTGPTTFDCAPVGSTTTTTAPATEYCGPAAYGTFTGRMIYWNQVPSQGLCQPGSINPSPPVLSNGVWTWTCVNSPSASGATTPIDQVACTAQVPNYNMGTICGPVVGDVIAFMDWSPLTTLPDPHMFGLNSTTNVPYCSSGYTPQTASQFQVPGGGSIWQWYCTDPSTKTNYACNAIGQ